MRNADTRLRDMQFWHLEIVEKDGKRGCILTCVADTGVPPVVRQVIEYTDFDFSIDIWVENGGDIEGTGRNTMVLMLPSER